MLEKVKDAVSGETVVRKWVLGPMLAKYQKLYKRFDCYEKAKKLKFMC